MKKNLKIISLGGFGKVTKNMFVYETPQDIIIVDVGVGFPEEEMLGVDLVIPDISYLQDKKHKIRAIFLSHGHDDHIGGLPYLLPQLGKAIPIYAPRWAKALVLDKLSEFGIVPNIEEVKQGSKIKVGGFTVEFVHVTHSIPDTMHLVIQTPVGLIYHAADFKLDLRPVMGEPTNQGLIRSIGKKGVLCMLSDCLRAEVPGFTPPEARLEEVFEEEIAKTKGKFIVTTMSSNLSRLKQAIDVARRNNRKVVVVGRSVEKSIKIAQKLKYISYPREAFVPKKAIKRYPSSSLALLVAGSQGQLGSALDRMVAGEIKEIKIEPNDRVVFSTDYIPGNETAIYRLIDDIYRQKASVAYVDIRSDIHVSGHGAQGDLSKLMEMVRPQYLVPIGGNYRHMVAYKRLAEKSGFGPNQTLIKDNGEIVEFDEKGLVPSKANIEIGQVMVDALGVGDVGNVVLRDRKILSEEGIVVAILPLNQTTYQLDGEPEIVSRGFVYIRENIELLKETKKGIREALKPARRSKGDPRLVRQNVQDFLEKFLFAKTGRRPMVLVVIIEV
ncbi:MAG TPA: ribonuclease J [Clostridia bacterium]|nr:ribonuclease J [Clostridia bacterium]